MSLNVIDLIRGQLGPALVSQSATQLGESESAISKAISALLPAVLGGLANSTDKPGLLDSFTGANSTGLLSNLLGGSAGNSTVAAVLTAIFGDKVPGLVNAVSSYSGVNNTSANSLLYMVTGATVGSVAKYAEDQNLDADGISNLLRDQKSTVSALLPAGLSLASMGVGGLANGDEYPETAKFSDTRTDETVEVNRAGQTHVNVDRTNENPEGGSIWKWLLPILLLALAAWFLWKQCAKSTTTETTTMSDSTVVDAAVVDTTMVADTASVSANRQTTTVALPAGQTINAYSGGIEDQVVTFLNSDEYKNSTDATLKDRWFNFDNLNFEFNSTQLTPESQVQLDNIKAILAAYPDAKIKIGAYTDRKGDDATNLILSQDRANAVKAALNSAQVVEAEGYGEKFATVDETASDDARLVDRKTAIRFMK